MQSENLELRRRLGGWIRRALLIGLEFPVGRVRAGVLARDARHHGVLEHQGGVAIHQIAAVDALAQEECLAVRAIVVGEKDLIEAPAEGGEGEGRSAKPHARATAAHPKR